MLTLLLKILVQTFAVAAGKRAVELAAEVACAAAKGCPETLEKIGERAKEKQAKK